MTPVQEALSANPGSMQWRLLLWALAITPIIGGLFWPRIYDVLPPWDAWNRRVASDPDGVFRLINQSLTAGTIVLLGWLCWKNRPANGLPRSGLFLWVCGMGVTVSFFLSAAFGSVPSFHVGLFGFPLVLTALWWLPPVSVRWLEIEVSRICLAYAYGSLLFGVLFFGWAIEWPYPQGYFEWFQIRLHGLFSNQGALAPFLVLFLLVSLFSGSTQRNVWHWFHLCATLVALVLSQSKVGWAMCLFVFVLFAARPLFLSFDRTARAALIASSFALCVLLLSFVDREVLLSKFAESNDNITTLTGRTDIWSYSLSLWRENPVFGYGNLLWTANMPADDLTSLGWQPNQTHSQFVQALAQTGIVGAVAFAVYGMGLLFFGYLSASSTAGISLILPCLLLARGLTESWLRHVVTDGNLFLHAICLAFIFCGLRAQTSRSSPS